MINELKKLFRSKVSTDKKTLLEYSKDASLFQIKPKAVISPKNIEDIKKLIHYVIKNKKKDPSLSITVRSGGTDMTGGPINDSLILDMTKYFNKIDNLKNNTITSQPGAYYRNFDKKTLTENLILPSYPASREICTIGGMVANNSGGEKSLKYGKTIDYVTRLKVVLKDGKEYTFKPLSKKELAKKLKLKSFEGEVYRKIFRLINKNYSTIIKAKPKVSKNSTGYNIWGVWDKRKFDLTKLFIGSQGTLGIITECTFNLVKKKKHSGMLVIFCENLDSIVDVVEEVLPSKPSSFESFDKHTMKLALKFFPQFLNMMGAKNFFSLFIKFIPEFLFVLRNGIPELTLLVEFEGDNKNEISKKILNLKEKLSKYKVKTKTARSKEDIHKYWLIRRESFNLLRHKIKDKQTAPFIDDMVVRPEQLKVFLPRIMRIVEKNNLLYTISGHIGDGNFHIIPLMILSDKNERRKIPKVSEEVYDLIISLKGSISGEHNDGLIRGYYLKKMYGKKMYSIFKEIKRIFDPDNIFNPGKKVDVNLFYALDHIKRG